VKIVIDTLMDVVKERGVLRTSDIEETHEVGRGDEAPATNDARQTCDGSPVDRDLEVLACFSTTKDVGNVVAEFSLGNDIHMPTVADLLRRVLSSCPPRLPTGFG